MNPKMPRSKRLIPTENSAALTVERASKAIPLVTSTPGIPYFNSTETGPSFMSPTRPFPFLGGPPLSSPDSGEDCLVCFSLQLFLAIRIASVQGLTCDLDRAFREIQDFS